MPTYVSKVSYLTKEQFGVLLGVVDREWYKDILIFTVLTGMRLGEVENLRWQDVDTYHRKIIVRSTQNFRAKCDKTRVIPLHPLLIDVIKKRTPLLHTERVFHEAKTSFISHLFKRYVRKAGLDGNIHFHSLRHTFATWLVAAGTPIYEVKKLLGHSSVRVTEIYAHMDCQRLEDTVSKLTLEY